MNPDEKNPESEFKRILQNPDNVIMSAELAALLDSSADPDIQDFLIKAIISTGDSKLEGQLISLENDRSNYKLTVRVTDTKILDWALSIPDDKIEINFNLSQNIITGNVDSIKLQKIEDANSFGVDVVFLIS